MEYWRQELYGNYLIHYGIKGQKWGDRNYQYEDGSLTPEGKIRYGVGDGDNRGSSPEKVSKKRIKNSTESVDAKYLSKNGELNSAGKKKYSVNEDGTYHKKSHREKLTELYKSKGFSDEVAAKKAKSRDITEKALIAIGAVAVTAAVTTVAVKKIRENRDETIKMGSLLNRVAINDSTSLHDRFYAANNAKDIKKYQGIYGGHQLGGINGINQIYNKKIAVNQDIKIAGHKTAFNEFKKLYESDPEFAKAAKTIGKEIHVGNRAYGKAYGDGWDLKKLYQNFNVNQVRAQRNAWQGVDSKKAWDKFESALRKSGYQGVKDVNDRKFSGYMAKTANIYFKNDDIFKVKSVDLMNKKEIAQAGLDAWRQIAVDKQVANLPVYALLGAGAAGTASFTMYNKDQRQIGRRKGA